MDACDPKIDIKNLKKLVKQNTGAELNLTREQICDAYSSIQEEKLPLPPMVLTKDGRYMLDRKSPISAKEYETLLGSTSKLSELRRVARKAGLASYKGMTKDQIVDAATSILRSKNIHEPIRLRTKTTPSMLRSAKTALYPNNLNVNNANGNGIRNVNSAKENNNNNNFGTNFNENQNGNGNLNANRNGNANRNQNGNVNRNQNGNVSQNNVNRNLNALNTPKPKSNRPSAYNWALQKSRNNAARPRNVAAAAPRNNRGTLNYIRRPRAPMATAAVNSRGRPTPVEAKRSEKEIKLANLEKMVRNRAQKLNTKKIQFMNDSQKYMSSYKNNKNTYNLAKARVENAFKRAYSEESKARTDEENVKKINANFVQPIKDEQIKNAASKLLAQYKTSRSDEVRKNIQSLKTLNDKLDMYNSQSRNQIIKQALNAIRNKALTNIKNFNMKNGFANLTIAQNKVIDELTKNKNMDVAEFNSVKRDFKNGKLSVNDLSKKVKQNQLYKIAKDGKLINKKNAVNVLTNFRNDKINFNTAAGKIKNMIPENGAIQERPTNKPENTTQSVVQYRNNIIRRLENRKSKNGVNVTKINAFITSIKNVNTMNKINEILNKNVNPYLLNANSKIIEGYKQTERNLRSEINSLRRNLETRPNNTNTKMQLKEALEKMNKIKRVSQSAIKEAQKRETEAEAKVLEIQKKLNTRSNLTPTEVNQLEGELKAAKAKETEFEQVRRKMEENLAAARAAQAAANRKRNNEVAKAKARANASIKEAQNAASVKIGAATQKVASLQEQLNQRSTLTPNQVKNLTNQFGRAQVNLNTAKKQANVNIARAKENANKRVAAAEAAAEAKMKELRNQANKEVQEAMTKVSAANNEKAKALANLANQKSKVNSLTSELEKAKKLGNNTANLERQLSKEKEQVAAAQQASREAESKVKNAENLVASATERMETAVANKRVANEARAKAEQEMVSSRDAANAAKKEANRIALELQSSKTLSQQEIEKLRRNMQTAMNTRQTEMQNIINAKNRAIAAGEKELTAMRNTMGKLSTRIENQNKKLTNQLEKINEIQKAKNASNAEKARLKENIEKQLAQLNSTSKQIQQITQNKSVLQSQRNNLQKQLTNTQRIVSSLQTNLQKSKVAGMWQGAATRGLGTQLRSTQTNLNRAQKEVGIARRAVKGLQVQRNTLQRATTLNQERAQANITNLQARLGAARTQKNLLASGLKNAEYRQRLYKLVDVTDNAGAMVVRDSRFANAGFKRRSYKNDIMNPITGMNRLREIESEIKAAKAAANKRYAQKSSFNFGKSNTPATMTRGQMLQNNNQPRPTAENTMKAQAYSG